jgi:hypothetical protein
MNMKRIFGAALTILGIGLIYAAVLFVYSMVVQRIQSANHFRHCWYIIFVAGIGLIRTQKMYPKPKAIIQNLTSILLNTL